MERDCSFFDQSFKVRFDDWNTVVIVAHYDLRQEQVTLLEKEVHAAANAFKNALGRLALMGHKGSFMKKIKIFVFPCREQYKKVFGRFSIASIEASSFSDDGQLVINVYANHTFCDLRRSLVLALASDSLFALPRVLAIGIADYIVHGCLVPSLAQLKMAAWEVGGNIRLDKLLDVADVDDMDDMDDSMTEQVLYAGKLLLAFFEINHPKYLKELLQLVANHGAWEGLDEGEEEEEELEEEFKRWMLSLDVGVRDEDAFKIRPGLSIGERGVHVAVIVDSIDEEVGYFPSQEYLFFRNGLRVNCESTGDFFDVGAKYTYMKVIEKSYQNLVGQLCDRNGNSYYNSNEFKLQAKNLLVKEKLPSTRRVEYFEMLSRSFSFSCFRKGLTNKAASACMKGLENSKTEELSHIKKILEESTWISHLQEVDLRRIDPDVLQQVFISRERLKIAADESCVSKIYAPASVYRYGVKIGELQSASGMFVDCNDDSGRYKFVYNDLPSNVHVNFTTPAYVTAIEGKTLHFVSQLSTTALVPDPPVLQLCTSFELDPTFVETEMLENLAPTLYDSESNPAFRWKVDVEELPGDGFPTTIVKKDEHVIAALRYVGMCANAKGLFVVKFGCNKLREVPFDVAYLKLMQDGELRYYLACWDPSEDKLTTSLADVKIDPMIVKAGHLVDFTQYPVGSLFRCVRREGAVVLYTDDECKQVGRLIENQEAFRRKIASIIDSNAVLSTNDFVDLFSGDGEVTFKVH